MAEANIYQSDGIEVRAEISKKSQNRELSADWPKNPYFSSEVALRVESIPEEYEIEWTYYRGEGDVVAPISDPIEYDDESTYNPFLHYREPSRNNLFIEPLTSDSTRYNTVGILGGWDTAEVRLHITEEVNELMEIDLGVYIGHDGDSDQIGTITATLPSARTLQAVVSLQNDGWTETVANTLQDHYKLTPDGVISFIEDAKLVLPARTAEALLKKIPEEIAGVYDNSNSEQIDSGRPLTQEREHTTPQRKNRPKQKQFRKELLEAYGSACAVCNWECRSPINSNPLVEAPHIRPVGEDGASNLGNGIVLCQNCHALFEDGAFSISNDYRICLSSDIDETTRTELEPVAGKRINLPQSSEDYPDREQLQWHRNRHDITPPATE